MASNDSFKPNSSGQWTPGHTVHQRDKKYLQWQKLSLGEMYLLCIKLCLVSKINISTRLPSNASNPLICGEIRVWLWTWLHFEMFVWLTWDWPGRPSPLDPSCGCVDRLRFCWRRLPPVERVVRMYTSLTLKNATMKGCFSSAPSRPTSPASLEVMLCPVWEGGRAHYNHTKQDLPPRSCWLDYILVSSYFIERRQLF